MRSQSWRYQLRQLPRSAGAVDARQVLHSPTSPIALVCARAALHAQPPSNVQRRGIASAPEESESPAVRPLRRLERGRSAARRTDAASSTGVPSPPALPGWFLKYNVRLSSGSEDQHLESSKMLELQDPYDDEVLLTIRCVDPELWEDVMARAARERKRRATKVQGLEANKTNVADQQVDPNFFNAQSLPAHKSPEKSEDAVVSAGKEAISEAPQDETASSSSNSKPKPERLPPLTETPDEAIWARVQGQILVRAILDTAARNDKKTAARNLVVFTPDHTAHDELDRFVEDAADLADADIVRVDASDIAELAGDYIDPASSGPGSIASLAYDTYEGGRASSLTDLPEPTDSQAESSTPNDIQSFDLANTTSSSIEDILKEGRKKLEQALNGGQVVGISLGPGLQSLMQQRAMARAESKADSSDDVAELDRWQRIKLKAFFDSLIAAPAARRAADLAGVPDNFLRQKFVDLKSNIRHPDRRRELFGAAENTVQRLAERYGPRKIQKDRLRLLVAHHVETWFGNDMPAATLVKDYKRSNISGSQSPQEDAASSTSVSSGTKGTIIHLRDIHLIYETPHGEDIIKILTGIVRKRQKDGEPIMIIGSSAEFSSDVSTPIGDLEDDNFGKDESFMRLQLSPSSPGARVVMIKGEPQKGLPPGLLAPVYPVEPGYRRLLELNLRHVQDLIARLGIPCSPNFFGEKTRTFLYAPGTQLLGNIALTPMQIEKIVLAADGFRTMYTDSHQLEMPHLAIALSIIDVLDKANAIGKVAEGIRQSVSHSSSQAQAVAGDRPQGQKSDSKDQRRVNIDELRRFASKHEQRLLPGIADPANIKTTYDDVHVAPETIDALKTATTLSLLRPDAFSYGVLANDRLSGLLLYGPPGTGKTLLAKAVAKDASATVLEVSGAQIYEKYVGEGEKMVRAVFSLAKRLSPCVVFIDEADALFGSRGLNSSRNTHREIINQFLREWDGMDNHSVFMMVATNRPFDLDDAVLRRLPRKILVDLPTAKDRESILKIHLKGETLDDGVSLHTLAEQTPFYSGSDLKNVCVAAALAAVKEENSLQLKHKDDKEFKLPAKRTLTKAHFDAALLEISASISEDMHTLNAVKKFDEQYGDRRGRRKKPSVGFGGMESNNDESSVRVRGSQDEQPRP